VQFGNLVKRSKLGRQAAVHAKDLFINQSSHGEAIEGIRKDLPKLDGVSSFALVVKAVNTVDSGTLMISAQNEKVLWILDLVGKE
jgi:hypothetical protein